MVGSRRTEASGEALELRLSKDGGVADYPVTAHVVVGFDRHESSLAALKVALRLAPPLGAQLDVVHAVDLSDYPVDPDIADWESAGQRVLAAEQAQVSAVLDGSGVGWTYHAWHGRPVKLLATVADEQDALLIVVGSRGSGFRTALERLLDGSVSHGLIGHQHRPVLVVP